MLYFPYLRTHLSLSFLTVLSFDIQDSHCFSLKLQITELLPVHKKFVDLKKQLELKLYDLSLFQGRAEQNEHHKVCNFFLSPS